MDETENIARTHLEHIGFKDIMYEPDGNVPPDFLVNGTIAVEVRRLNQHFNTGSGMEGLEIVARPQWDKLKKLLTTLGPPDDGRSWFVMQDFCRPLESWRSLSTKVRNSLKNFYPELSQRVLEIGISQNYSLMIVRADEIQETKFLMGGQTDDQAGGWLLREFHTNLFHCIEEKENKVLEFRSRYKSWWLVLVDHIGVTWSTTDQEWFLPETKIDHAWDRVRVIHPKRPDRYLDV